MATRIYLGHPPAHIEKWIKEHMVDSSTQYAKYKIQPITFKAENDGTTVKFGFNNNVYAADPQFANQNEMEYQLNSLGWQAYDIGSNISLNKDDEVSFRVKTARSTICGSLTDSQSPWLYETYHWEFSTNKQVNIYGNLNSLLNPNLTDASLTDSNNRTAEFYDIFGKVQSINQIIIYCCDYFGLFENCANINELILPEFGDDYTTLDNLDITHVEMRAACAKKIIFPNATYADITSYGIGEYYNGENRLTLYLICNPADNTMIVTKDKTFTYTAELYPIHKPNTPTTPDTPYSPYI